LAVNGKKRRTELELRNVAFDPVFWIETVPCIARIDTLVQLYESGDKSRFGKYAGHTHCGASN
jgi:hypothetical protein